MELAALPVTPVIGKTVQDENELWAWLVFGVIKMKFANNLNSQMDGLIGSQEPIEMPLACSLCIYLPMQGG